MRIGRAFPLLLVLATGSPGVMAGDPAFEEGALVVAPAARDDDWRWDITFLRTELPKRHPNLFFQRPRELFEADLEALRIEVPTLTNDRILIRLQQAVAALRDGHTVVDWQPAVTSGYPLQLRWFSDGLFVTRTSPSLASACGARLSGIGEHPLDEVYERVTSVISHDNPHWARFRSPQFIIGMQILRTLELVPESGEAAFQFETPDGREAFTIPVKAASMNSVWTTLLAPIEETDETPLYLRRTSLNYWDHWDPDTRTLYIKYNVCRDGGPETFAAFTKRVMALADRERPERLVIDLRNNAGGSDAVIGPLIDAIRARPWIDAPDRLFVVIGPETFSSAVLNAITLRRLTRATLVGEPTGGNANGYGEVKSFFLPARGITVWHSTKHFVIDPANPGAVEPDILVTTSSEEYFAQRDPVLERILESLNVAADEASQSRRRTAVRSLAPRVCR